MAVMQNHGIHSDRDSMIFLQPWWLEMIKPLLLHSDISFVYLVIGW